jgi:hypothetical protein
MKKEYMLLALAIGLVVFLFNWIEKAGAPPNNSPKMAAIALGCYFTMKRHFAKEALLDKGYKITYGEAYKIGAFICLIASVFGGLLFYIMPSENEIITFGTEKLIRSLDVLFSIIIIGIISVAISSAILIKRQP